MTSKRASLGLWQKVLLGLARKFVWDRNTPRPSLPHPPPPTPECPEETGGINSGSAGHHQILFYFFWRRGKLGMKLMLGRMQLKITQCTINFHRISNRPTYAYS